MNLIKLLTVFSLVSLALASCATQAVQAPLPASRVSINSEPGAVMPTPAGLSTLPATPQLIQSAIATPTQGVAVIATATNKPAVPAELSFPIRAAFYYPWFPQAWNQNGMDPFSHYEPGIGFYNQDQTGVIQSQIVAMQYGRIQLGIASWWGQGQHTDQRIPELLKIGEQTGFHWALYVESEGQGNPDVGSIQSDLKYIRDNYANSAAYLKLNGRFVVFVYSDGADRCGMAQRWKQANTVGAYLVLKIFPGYKSCAAQPDGWHQYAPAADQKRAGGDSFTISPGFWKANESGPRLERNFDRWDTDIQAMIASRANFQLITTFNEWGEGTAVESSQSWKSCSGYGYYLDALHYDGKLDVSSAPPQNCSSTSPSLADEVKASFKQIDPLEVLK